MFMDGRQTDARLIAISLELLDRGIKKNICNIYNSIPYVLIHSADRAAKAGGGIVYDVYLLQEPPAPARQAYDNVITSH